MINIRVLLHHTDWLCMVLSPHGPHLQPSIPLQRSATNTHPGLLAPRRHKRHQTAEQKQYQLSVCSLPFAVACIVYDYHTIALSLSQCCYERWREDSHVRVANVCTCHECKAGRSQHCVGRCRNAQLCQNSLTLRMMKHWWDSRRQLAAEKSSLPESMVHIIHAYLHSGCFIKLQHGQCFCSFSWRLCKWRVHGEIAKVRRVWAVPRGRMLSIF